MGGKAFKNCSKISYRDFELSIKENLELLLKNEFYLIYEKDFIYVGSLDKNSKKKFGDLDVAVDKKIFFKKNLLTNNQKSYDYLKFILKPYNYEIHKLNENLTSVKFPFERKFVQVDLMFTDSLEWANFTMNKHNWLCNEILFNFCKYVKFNYADNSSWKRYVFDLQNGCFEIEQNFISPKTGKLLKNAVTISREKVTDKPREFSFKFFGTNEIEFLCNLSLLLEKIQDRFSESKFKFFKNELEKSIKNKIIKKKRKISEKEIKVLEKFGIQVG